MNYDNLFAACNLVGKEINGWFVKKMLPKPNKIGGTGGTFSICYIVEREGKEYFMKVLDLRICMGDLVPFGLTNSEYMEQCLREFNYEKVLSAYCKNNHIKNIIQYYDDGDAIVDGFPFNNVSYIVYEKAEGDIRKTLDLSKKAIFSEKLKNISQKLKSLHDIAVGMQQLHQKDISHQDIKPSNILSIKDKSKIGDLGRSLCFASDIKCPYPLEFNGDWNYAPPEAAFGNTTRDKKDLYQIDNYMLGSLIVYYICGVSFNVLLNNHLPMPLLKMCESGRTYEDSKADLIHAFHLALNDFEKEIPLDNIKSELTAIVEYLCNPIAEKRGHPKNINVSTRTSNYDLIRTYSELDKLYRKTQIELMKK